MPEINKAYEQCLRNGVGLENQKLVDDFVNNAPVNETPEERQKRLEGQYVEYYQNRLSHSIGMYYRNVSQMSDEQKEHYKGQLGKLKKEIASERDELLKFVLIMPIKMPASDEKSANAIIYELHLLLRSEISAANYAIKKAMDTGTSMDDYYKALLEKQVEAFSIALRNGGTFATSFLTIDDADPYEDLLYRK